MKHRLPSWVCAAAVLAGMLFWPLAATAQPVVYALDPAHTSVTFEVLHFGTSTTRARFAMVTGDVTLDRSTRRGEMGLRIKTGSVNSGISVFDARLRQADLLATEEHPEAYFVASDFRFEADQLVEVRGEFTLRGKSQPLSLFAKRFACRMDARLQREVCGGDFEGEFLRSSVGATFGLPFVGDSVRLLVQAEGIRR